jgi:hypothetical protein
VQDLHIHLLGLDPTVVSPGAIWDTRGLVAMEPKIRFRLETGLRGEVCRTGFDPTRSKIGLSATP